MTAAHFLRAQTNKQASKQANKQINKQPQQPQLQAQLHLQLQLQQLHFNSTCHNNFIAIWFQRAKDQEKDPFPSMWQHIKQIHIPKSDTHAREPDQAVSSKSLRPITIEATLWRVAAKAIVKDPAFQHWISLWTPNHAHGGVPGRGVHTAVAQLDTAFKKDSILISMDFAEAFDRVHPDLAVRALCGLGLPSELATALSWIWGNQKRWLHMSKFVSPENDLLIPAFLKGTLFSR